MLAHYPYECVSAGLSIKALHGGRNFVYCSSRSYSRNHFRSVRRVFVFIKHECHIRISPKLQSIIQRDGETYVGVLLFRLFVRALYEPPHLHVFQELLGLCVKKLLLIYAGYHYGEDSPVGRPSLSLLRRKARLPFIDRLMSRYGYLYFYSGVAELFVDCVERLVEFLLLGRRKRYLLLFGRRFYPRRVKDPRQHSKKVSGLISGWIIKPVPVVVAAGQTLRVPLADSMRTVLYATITVCRRLGSDQYHAAIRILGNRTRYPLADHLIFNALLYYAFNVPTAPEVGYFLSGWSLWALGRRRSLRSRRHLRKPFGRRPDILNRRAAASRLGPDSAIEKPDELKT